MTNVLRKRIKSKREAYVQFAPTVVGCCITIEGKERLTVEKAELIERSKMYLKMLGDGVHPITGAQLFIIENMEDIIRTT